MDAPSFLRTAELRRYLQDTFSLSGHNHNGVNSSLTAPKIMSFDFEALAAGVDISTRALLVCPTGYTITVALPILISNGSPVGIDDSNTSVHTIKVGSTTIITSTFNTAHVFPVTDTSENLGFYVGASAQLLAGETLTYTIVNGTTAATPKFSLQLEYFIV